MKRIFCLVALFLGLASSVFAQTTITSAIGELEIHILLPLKE